MTSDEHTNAAWQGGTETILVCEDEPMLRRLANMILSEGGYTVVEAEDGEDAVKVASEYDGRIDLLLTDLIMPHMNGRDLATTLQEKHPDLKVVFISGYASDMIDTDGVVPDDLAFLQKPFKPDQLLQLVREVLDETK